jgi:hypothetical protein
MTTEWRTMSRALRLRLWLEAALAVGSGVLGVLTFFWHDWIEAVFGVDPDHHSGSLEWVIAFGLLAVATALALALRYERRRVGYVGQRGA